MAALVAIRLFVIPKMRALADFPPEEGLVIKDGTVGQPDTTVFLQCNSGTRADGIAAVDVEIDQRSHMLPNVVQANAWLRV